MDVLTAHRLGVTPLVCVSIVVVCITLECAVSLAGAWICHVVGRRRLSARLAHGGRLLLLFNGIVIFWTAGLAGIDVLTDSLPTSSDVVHALGLPAAWVSGLLLWTTLTVEGWLWLAPKSDARYRRVLARRTEA